jgi:N-acetylglucosaminyldiphosphoundecaprenol N-acetyl-beta-D-mannosaminyltransferase
MRGTRAEREYHDGAEADATAPDDLAREVYVLLGAPIDSADMATTMQRIDAAAQHGTPFLLSTVNVNFLIASQSNAAFRESLCRSDLCTVDGMPVKWIARALRIPVTERTAGADLFEALKRLREPERALKVFLFGGKEGAAAAACERMNAEHNSGRNSGLTCVGSFYPGFGTIEEMSSEETIATINASGADVLLVALGAAKGQAWLLHNHARLRIPVRAHVGAAINVQAGTVRRAPQWMQTSGLEWLWRIKEEPALWRRYTHDGAVLLRLLAARILPLALLDRWHAWRSRGHALAVTRSEDEETVTLSISGAASAQTIAVALPHARYAAERGKDVVINLRETRHVDARFLGLLLMLEKKLNARARRLTVTGIGAGVGRMFRLNGFRPPAH